ncbi:hypothetical protein [Bartonella sp. WD12.1]|uniref:hypothetical protein n=1 Tax=Bartonella sp. WD12.1 TaxID=1933903 RepID=UPI0009992917|nr:hypothetical protein [Bartonella sp. WD12.1]OPB29040.1 hypothetical protein BWD121_000450 [Bartonella sp. WD12.1]
MNIKHLGFIFFFAFGSTSSVQGASLMSVKGLALDIAHTSSSKDLHFGEQDSDTTNGAFLNISCTDHNKWTTNYGQGAVFLIRNNGGNRNLVSSNRRLRRPSWWLRIHTFSY